MTRDSDAESDTVWYVGTAARAYHTDRSCSIIADRADADLRTADSVDDLWHDLKPCGECEANYDQRNERRSDAYKALTTDETSLDALRGEKA